MSDSLLIRAVAPEDREQWQALWHGYNRFYESSVPGHVTEKTWQRILDHSSTVGGLVAEDTTEKQLLGFIHYVIHPRTWSVDDACYLEDLYVAAAARVKGIGKKLCMELKDLCAAQGLSRIYWHTRENNDTARKLYDQIAVKDDFIRYVMPLSA